MSKNTVKLYGGVDDLILPNQPVGEDGEIIKTASEIDSSYHEKLDRVRAYVSTSSKNLSNSIIVSSFNRLDSSVESVLNLKTRRLNDGEYKDMKWKYRKKRETVTFLRDYTDVLMLQVLIKKMGYSINLTSKFDAKTVSSLKAFQKDVGITVDGEFGPKTLAKIKYVLKKYKGISFDEEEVDAYDFEIDSTVDDSVIDNSIVDSVDEVDKDIVDDLEDTGDKSEIIDKGPLSNRPVNAVYLEGDEFIIYAGDGKVVKTKKFGFKLPSRFKNPRIELGGNGKNEVSVKLLNGDGNTEEYDSKYINVASFNIKFDKFGGSPEIEFPEYRKKTYNVQLNQSESGVNTFEIK